MVLATGGRDGGHPWRNHILPLSAGSHWVGEKSSCKQYCIANLGADVNHGLKWFVEDERAEGRLPSYLPLPTEEAGFVPFLPFSSSAHVTSLLETLKRLPFALRKKSKLLPVTGKVLLAPVLAPSPASFSTALPHFILLWPQSPPLVPGTGSAHSHFPASASATSSCAGSIPSPRSLFICQLLRAQRPSATIVCGNLPVAIFVLLWFQCPSLFHLYMSTMIVYLLADCLIGIRTSRQQKLLHLRLYLSLAHGRYSKNMCLLIH